MPLTEPSTILAFKAGRAFRREGTNIVEPRPDKGAVVIERGEDEELHFMWKNRATEETEEVRPSQIQCKSQLSESSARSTPSLSPQPQQGNFVGEPRE